MFKPAALASLMVLTLLTSFSGVLAAESKDLKEFKTFKDDKYVKVQVQKHDSFRLSQDCFKTKTPKCQAFEATAKKIALSPSKIPLEGNPAARFCLDHQALNRILIDTGNKQYDYCLFKDGSMIDAWDLYYHSYPQKVIK